MSLVTQYQPGTFCWVDLATSDAAGAEQFYSALFDWTTEQIPMGDGMFYVMCRRNGHNAAAFYQPTPEHSGGLPPHWKAYIAVADIEASTRRAESLGGQVCLEPMDVFQSGRMAMIADPTGATFALWQPRDHPGAGIVNEPGSLVWTELMTSSAKTAGDFYTGLFDWTIESRDMERIVYHMFNSGDRPAAGMVEVTPEMGPIPPHWAVHFAVADVDASAARAQELGGEISMGPMDIPDVGRFACLKDPQGAYFFILKLLQEPTPYEA